MAEQQEVKSLLQRLLERRRAIESGDPTGGQQLNRGVNQPPVQEDTAPVEVNRFRRIQQLEAELKEIESSMPNRFRKAENAIRSGAGSLGQLIGRRPGR